LLVGLLATKIVKSDETKAGKAKREENANEKGIDGQTGTKGQLNTFPALPRFFYGSATLFVRSYTKNTLPKKDRRWIEAGSKKGGVMTFVGQKWPIKVNNEQNLFNEQQYENVICK
jgi:hypothetical protein